MLITEQVSGIGFNGETAAPMLDLSYGGQQGYMPQLGGFKGKTFDEWVSNAAYITNNIVPIPLRTPAAFKLYDAGTARRLRKTWIDLFSLHAMTINGLESTVTLDTDEHRVGAAGEMQEEFVKANRARSTITYEFQEKLGKPINRFLDFLIRYTLLDPDTQTALLGTVPQIRGNFKGNIYTPDYWTGTILFVELDLLNINVVDAWLCQNVAPKSPGEVTGKRDLGSSKELKLYSIEMSSITTTNEMVRAMAQNIVDTMSIFSKNPDYDMKLPVNPDDAALSTQNNDGAGFNRDDIPVAPDGSNIDIAGAFNH